MTYYVMDVWGTHIEGYTPFWKIFIEGNFKDDKEAIAYYNANLRPNYPNNKTRLSIGSLTTRRAEKPIMIDGKLVSDDNTIMIFAVIAIIIILLLLVFR